LNDLEVKCYSGHTYAERPKSFLWEGMEYEIEELERVWQEPGERHFQLRTRDNKLFHLWYNEWQKQWSGVEIVRSGQEKNPKLLPSLTRDRRRSGEMLKEILKILENDARVTAKQISTMTGIPRGKVAKLIKQAEKDRAILKYKTLINWEKVENEQVWALIEVRITPQRDVGYDAIAKRIYLFPQARTVYLVSGTYDLLVIVTGKTMHEVANFVSQKLAPVEGVQETTTHFMLKRYKEDGEILEGGEEVKRQPVIL